MTLPLFLTDRGRLDGIGVDGTYVLDGPEGRHAATVRRLRVGEKLEVADGAGRKITGQITQVDGDELTVKVVALDVQPRPTPMFTLVQALAKSDRDEAAIEMATELGVDRIVPWQADRSIVQWRGDRSEKSRQKWVDIVRAAAKQSRRSWVPDIDDVETTRSLALRMSKACVTYVLSAEAQTPLVQRPLPAAGEILIIVGPEGGISPEEMATLTGAGAIPARLGPTILRSSSAGPCAIAILSAADRWDH